MVNKEGCAFTSASADGRRLIYACSSMPVGTHTVTFSTEKFGGWPGGKGGPARGWGSLGRGGLGRHSPGLLEGNPQAQPLARCAASWPPKRRLARHTRHGQRTGLLGRPICSPGDRARSPTHPPTPPAASLPQAAPLRPASSWLSSRAPSWTWPPPSPRTPSASPASPASSPCRWGGGAATGRPRRASRRFTPPRAAGSRRDPRALGPSQPRRRSPTSPPRPPLPNPPPRPRPPQELSLKVINSSYTAAQAADAFEAHCDATGRPYARCTLAGRAVLASLNGNLARRPAALCFRLGECSAALDCKAENFNITSGNYTGDTSGLDACSITGVAGDAIVPPAGAAGRRAFWGGFGGAGVWVGTGGSGSAGVGSPGRGGARPTGAWLLQSRQPPPSSPQGRQNPTARASAEPPKTAPNLPLPPVSRGARPELPV